MSHGEREAVCPECGSPLVVSIEKNRKSGMLQIKFWCEGDYEDKFEFAIITDLKNEDLDTLLDKKGKVITRQIGLKLIDRESKPSWE